MGTPGITAHEAAIEGYLKDLEAADALVDPAEQQAERQRVEEALAELEAEATTKRNALATTAAKTLVVAEPESVIFGQSDGRQPSYNVQLSVDVETQFIVDSEPVGNPSDSGRLAPTAERPAPILGVRPEASEPTAETAAEPPVTLIADAGYSSANAASLARISASSRSSPCCAPSTHTADTSTGRTSSTTPNAISCSAPPAKS